MSYATRERQGVGEGWLLFAALVMVTGGIIRVFDALWAFDRDDELVGEIDAVWFGDNLAFYGWLWLVVGILLICAGFGVLARVQWARWFGIGMAVISAVTSMLWIYAFPIWALVGVVISFAVIYGLATYGEPLDDSRT